MSYRVSKLTLYDELTETVKHNINANERALKLP